MALQDDERIVFTRRDLLEPSEHLVMREHMDRYRLAASRMTFGAKVLDVGCGVGYGAFLLAEAGASSVAAVDRDEEAIAYARQEFAHPRVSYDCRNLDLDEQPWPSGQFDGITAYEILEHVSDPACLLYRIGQSLTATGRLCLSTPIIPTKQTNRWHRHEWSLEEVQQLLAAEFTIVEHAIQNGTIFWATTTRRPELTGVKMFNSETAKCRERLLTFCEGRGLDLGCGTVEKITPDAIGIDSRAGLADIVGPIDDLSRFADQSLPFVYSSHALEHVPFPVEVLKEWIRVIRPKGHLVLYLPDRELYRVWNPEHYWNPSIETVTTMVKEAARDMWRSAIIVHSYRDSGYDRYSFDLVAQID